jgi:hypothetical protein
VYALGPHRTVFRIAHPRGLSWATLPDRPGRPAIDAGVGPVLSLTILLEIDTIERFDSRL